MSTLLRRLGLFALEIWMPIVIVIAWWVWSVQAEDPFFPPLPEILQRFQEMWLFDLFVSDVLPSLRNLAIGFAIATVIGVLLGILLGRVRIMREMLEPLVHFMRSTPGVAMVPIFILILGFESSMKISIIAVSAVFPTLIATMDGVRSVDGTLLDTGRAYRLSGLQRVRHIYLPSASPQIFSGLQVSLQTAFVVMIASEMLGSTQGIGALTIKAQQSFQALDMWAGILLLGLLGYVINVLFLVVRGLWLSWYDESRKVASE